MQQYKLETRSNPPIPRIIEGLLNSKYNKDLIIEKKIVKKEKKKLNMFFYKRRRGYNYKV